MDSGPNNINAAAPLVKQEKREKDRWTDHPACQQRRQPIHHMVCTAAGQWSIDMNAEILIPAAHKI
ncbi:hypothetical protein [Oryza sativa Japonica Group]|uniref:Uncharacterized protein n=1 Tax=Oryza sativa subsp. japonica TaxID=39947 RepID=Q5JMQ2_ORYSJ|nr:hypothetical protein [Oryza sativa Japonica Group]